MKIKCIVACINANGEPDLFFVIVKCSKEQYEDGEHYRVAKRTALTEGYEPFLSYDENDPAGKAMLPLFEWGTASLIEA